MRRLATTSWLSIGAAALVLATYPAHAQAPAGVTAAVNPEATGTPPAALPHVLEIGADVVQNEHITTGPQGQAQLLFRDGSTMTLGPGGDLTIDSFVYDPAAQTAKLAMTASTGLFRFVGGRASKDEPVVLNTPTATIGIRGGINFTNIGANGETETSQAYGKDTTARSKSTGESVTLTKNGFTLNIKPNQPITTGQTDPGRIAGYLTAMRGRPGATGGATGAPNQNSQQAQAISASNSGQSPDNFVPASLGTTAPLGSVTTFTNQLVSTSAQTAAIGSSSAVSGSAILPSGNYVGGFVTPLANGLNTSGGSNNDRGLGLGGATYPSATYSDTSGGQTTRTNTTAVTLTNGIPQSVSKVEAFSNSVTGSQTDRLVASITGAKVAEFTGDSMIALGRLTGGAGNFSESSSCTGSQASFCNPTLSGSATLSSLQSSHFLVGVPATLLPTTGTFNFSLFGATSPTFADGSGSPGKFTGTLGVSFGVPSSIVAMGQGTSGLHGIVMSLDATIAMPNDGTFRLTTIGGLSNFQAQINALQSQPGTANGTISGVAELGATFKGTPIVTLTGVSKACPSGSCTAFVIGALAGPGGVRAGILYTLGNLNTTNGLYNLSQLIIGVAAFKR
jgi:hypothetical protein